MKLCPHCGLEKEEGCFGKDSQRKDGLKVYCKDCRKARYRANKAPALKRAKRYYAENTDHAKSKASERYNKLRDEINHSKREITKEKQLAAAASPFKTCEKCKEEKLKSEFYTSKFNGGTRKWCKTCVDVSIESTKEVNRLYQREKYKNKPEVFKEYRERIPKEKVREWARNSYQRNKEAKAKKRAERREETNARTRELKRQPSKSRHYYRILKNIDNAKMVDGFLTVTCKLCGKRFAPTKGLLGLRIAAIRGVRQGEHNLYCSDQCKDACPLYRFNYKQDVDPRSKLYVPKDEAEEARRCQTDHLKQLQIDECGHNYCDKCGQSADIVHLHHTQEIHSNGLDAITSAGHMLLCPDCHIELHQECA